MSYDAEAMREMIGFKIKKVLMSTEYLVFVGENQIGRKEFIYTVEGDCCSHSYFYDFYGMKKLVNDSNGVVTQINDKNLTEPDDANFRAGEVVAVYGIEIVTDHEYYGSQTSVLSFRNDSNGYYGGNLQKYEHGLSDKEKDELVDISNREWYVAQ